MSAKDSLTHHFLLRHLLVVLVHHGSLMSVRRLLGSHDACGLLGLGVAHDELVHEAGHGVLLEAGLLPAWLAGAASHYFVKHWQTLQLIK